MNYPFEVVCIGRFGALWVTTVVHLDLKLLRVTLNGRQIPEI